MHAHHTHIGVLGAVEGPWLWKEKKKDSGPHSQKSPWTLLSKFHHLKDTQDESLLLGVSSFQTLNSSESKSD